MNAIKATVRNRRVEVDVPTDWPDGTELTITLIPSSEVDEMTEDDQGDDPESIERWCAEFEAIPTLPLSPKEESDTAGFVIVEQNKDPVKPQGAGAPPDWDIPNQPQHVSE